MTSNAQLTDELREMILAEPNTVLEDHDLMRALVSANEKVMGENIVDLRGIAMNRLESRLDKLENTHRSVIAAAYENLAGANQIHRAVLRMLDPLDFETFLTDLGGDVAEILRVDTMRLVLESVRSQPRGAAHGRCTFCRGTRLYRSIHHPWAQRGPASSITAPDQGGCEKPLR